MQEDTPKPWLEVDQLTARLRKLKEELLQYRTGDFVEGSAVPPHLREEVAKVYDQHGGIDLLAQVTHLTLNTIKCWHAKFRRDPMYFQKQNPCARFYRRPPFAQPTLDPQSLQGLEAPVKSTLDKSAIKEEVKLVQKFRNAKTAEDYQRLLPAEVFTKIQALRPQVEEVVAGRQKFSPQLKQDISKLVVMAKSARPVAVLLGLNERILMSWGEFIVGELGKLPSAYKLN